MHYWDLQKQFRPFPFLTTDPNWPCVAVPGSFSFTRVTSHSAAPGNRWFQSSSQWTGVCMSQIVLIVALLSDWVGPEQRTSLWGWNTLQNSLDLNNALDHGAPSASMGAHRPSVAGGQLCYGLWTVGTVRGAFSSKPSGLPVKVPQNRCTRPSLQQTQREQFGNNFHLLNAIINAVLRPPFLWEIAGCCLFSLWRPEAHRPPHFRWTDTANSSCLVRDDVFYIICSHRMMDAGGCWAPSQGKADWLYFKRNSTLTLSYFGHRGPERGHELDKR